MKNQKVKTWEFALVLAFVLTLTVGAYAEHGQQELSEKLLRLHVLAASDSDEDQMLKLKVRDRVLSEAGRHLTQARTAEEAMLLLEAALPELETVAQDEIHRQGYDYPVSAQVTSQRFPTRNYTGFSLPAGEYDSLQIVIGNGGGKNWWCVVFPPLCEAAAEETLADTAVGAGLTAGELRLITQDTPEYVIKFKAIELWEEIKRKLKR